MVFRSNNLCHFSFKTRFKIQSVTPIYQGFYESILRPLTAFLSDNNSNMYFLSFSLEKRLYEANFDELECFKVNSYTEFVI